MRGRPRAPRWRAFSPTSRRATRRMPGLDDRLRCFIAREGGRGAAGPILEGAPETVREPGEQRGVRPLDRTASRPFERLGTAAAGAQLFLALCRNIADFAAVPGVPSDAGGAGVSEGRRQGAALRLGGFKRGGSMPANANGRSARTRKLVTRRGAELQVSELEFGGAPLGNLYRPMTEKEARLMLDASLGHGLPILRHRAALRARAVGRAASTDFSAPSRATPS